MRNPSIFTARQMRIGLFVTAVGVLALGPPALTQDSGKADLSPWTGDSPVITVRGHRYDLAKRDGLEALVTALDVVVKADDKKAAKKSESDKKASKDRTEKAAKKAEKAGKEEADQRQDAANPSKHDTDADDEVDTDDAPAKGKLPKDAERCYAAMRHVAKSMLDGKTGQSEGILEIQEMNEAAYNATRTPYLWVPKIEITDAIVNARRLTLNACGRGSAKNPSRNLETYDTSDLSKIDPRPTPFWSRPKSIADLDLYHGFGRTEIPPIAGVVCDYAKAHTGTGAHAAFDVLVGGERYKAKFGEVHTEPFGTRIWWALGYPALPTDYAPELRVHYDRAIFTDFNKRGVNTLRLTAFGIPVKTIHDTEYLDPFKYLKYAMMKDGTRLSAADFRSGLFGLNGPGSRSSASPGRRLPKHPEQEAASYDAGFEKRIDYVTFGDVNLRARKLGKGVKEIGSWSFNELDHADRRELRGLCILNAWLDNWDIRWPNTRLLTVKGDDGVTRIRCVQSDLGALFGTSSGIIRHSSDGIQIGSDPIDPNSYSWYFTAELRRGQTSVPIKDYMPIAKSMPFYQMNIDDARWAAQLIGQLSENQIKAALIGSGYDASTARLLLEKLVARRDKMIRDFGLESEVALLRPGAQPDKQLAYDPATGPALTATLPSGETVRATLDRAMVVADGKLMERTATGATVTPASLDRPR